ncbi:MAG: hypothetical protein NT086_18895 [Proteobacteria bacterium]|nr:hypothetical protein [Pseudomonadota bacterium]
MYSHLPARLICLSLPGTLGVYRLSQGINGHSMEHVLLGIGFLLFALFYFMQPILFKKSLFFGPLSVAANQTENTALGSPKLRLGINYTALVFIITGFLFGLGV